MIGLGTIINTAAIVAGGILGLIFRKALKERVQETVMTTCGVCVLFVGIGGALAKMLTVAEGGLETRGTLMMILTLELGALAGELINIERGFERFGDWLKRVSHSEGDNRFLDAFLSASLTVSIGAMAVVGSIQDGILGDHSTLIAKAILDFIIVMIMAASLGKGCIFSAIPVFVFQGSMTLLARLLQPVMTDAAVGNLSLVGSVMVFCVGLNIVWGKKVRVANLLPAVVFAVISAFFG